MEAKANSKNRYTVIEGDDPNRAYTIYSQYVNRGIEVTANTTVEELQAMIAAAEAYIRDINAVFVAFHPNMLVGCIPMPTYSACTLLQQAVWVSNQAVVKYLVNVLGADIDYSMDKSPLWIAAYKLDISMIHCLLDLGASTCNVNKLVVDHERNSLLYGVDISSSSGIQDNSIFAVLMHEVAPGLDIQSEQNITRIIAVLILAGVPFDMYKDEKYVSDAFAITKEVVSRRLLVLNGIYKDRDSSLSTLRFFPPNDPTIKMIVKNVATVDSLYEEMQQPGRNLDEKYADQSDGSPSFEPNVGARL